jgi:flagellar biosynthesis GTPase FlhF
VGIDIHQSIKPRVDPRKYIDIAGATGVPLLNHVDVSKQIVHDGSDDLLDDDFDMDQLNQLADNIINQNTTPTSSNEMPKTPSETTEKRAPKTKAAKKPAEPKPKKPTKAKRARDTGASSQKTKRQKKNVPKKNEPKENDIVVQSKESDMTVQSKESAFKTAESKENELKTAMPKENKLEQRENKKHELIEIECEQNKSNSMKDECKIDLFGNVIMPRDKISDDDTIFTNEDDYYFDNDNMDHCCDSLLFWLEKNIVIVSDSQ